MCTLSDSNILLDSFWGFKTNLWIIHLRLIFPPLARWCCQSWKTRIRARPPWREPAWTGEDGKAETQTVSGLAGPDAQKMSLIYVVWWKLFPRNIYRWLPPQDSFQELNLYDEPRAPNGSSNAATNEQEGFCQDFHSTEREIPFIFSKKQNVIS